MWSPLTAWLPAARVSGLPGKIVDRPPEGCTAHRTRQPSAGVVQSKWRGSPAAGGVPARLSFPGRHQHTLAKAATAQLSLLQKLWKPGLGWRLFLAGTTQWPQALRNGHVLIRAERLPASPGNLLVSSMSSMSSVPPSELQDLRGGSEDESGNERTIILGWPV